MPFCPEPSSSGHYCALCCGKTAVALRDDARCAQEPKRQVADPDARRYNSQPHLFGTEGEPKMLDALSAAERLAIERACERLTHVYCRALDLGDMNAAADCFAENGSFARPMNPGQVIQGREAIRASLITRPKTLLTKHLTTNVMIEVESADSARGLSYLTMIST